MDTTLAFVGKEIIVPAGARHEVVVPIDDVGAASCLMIRNANDLNQPSRVRVYAIKLLDASATMLPSPLNVPGGLPVSPLVGLTPGRLIPNVFSMANYEAVNGAIVEGNRPLIVLLPRQQWAYGFLFPLQRHSLTAVDYRGPIVAQLDLTVTTGCTGIGVIDRSMNFLGTEQIFETGRYVVQIQINDPAQMYAIALRNAATDGLVTRVDINGVGAFEPAGECLAERRHNLGHDLFVILSPSKTGTQTIEQTLLALSPAVEIRRLHYATEQGAGRYHASGPLAASLLGDGSILTKSIIAEAKLGDAVRNEIADVRRLGGRIAFITAFREPIDRGVAATLHSLPFLLPAFEQLYAAGPGFVELLANGLIASWRKELAGRVYQGTEDGLRLWWRCLDDKEYYSEEFGAIVGFDLRAHPFDHERGYALFEHDIDTVLALRTRDIQCALPRALSELTGRSVANIVSTNIGADKNTGPLYRDFRNHFTMPVDLVDAIYARHPWLNYFYSASEIEVARRGWLAPPQCWTIC